jgi:formylglycine-generating enzyme required for sulfatase activity
MRAALEQMDEPEDVMVRTQEMPRAPTLSIDASQIPRPPASVLGTEPALRRLPPPTIEELRVDRDFGARNTAVESTPKPGFSWSSPVIWFGAGLLVAFAASGVAWYGFADMMPNEAAAVPPPVKPAAISIPEGPFLRGLSNDYRLMFADLCPKIADDPKTECKEEIALAGEYPMKEITVGAFKVDAWEVSNAEWRACEKAGKCEPVQWNDCANWTVRGLIPFLEIPQDLRASDRPVVCVNRDEATAYCEQAGGRLPTQDEWEKAARGADAYLFPWGTNWSSNSSNWGERDMTRIIVAGDLDGFPATSPVSSFEDGKSPYGVLNMAGNAAEWVAPGTEDVSATARGGSWRSDPLAVRATVRFPLKRANRRTDVGFRCAFDK